MKHITSRDNPLFKELKKLAASSRARREAGQTLLDGAHLVQAYLASGSKPRQVLITQGALGDPEIAALLDDLTGTPLIQLSDALFGELSELKTVSGILALIDVPEAVALPVHSRFCLLLEDIQDPGNLGSMLRTAAAAGCDAAYLSQGCADAWSPKVLRAGMGGHFALSIHEGADLSAVATDFSGTVYAAALGVSRSLYSRNLQEAVAFAIGNEGAGLSAGLLRHCEPVTIPMPGRVESLNAAAAAAVCLFEAVRQRA
jgi:TrmH family RNA methyltransferase